HDRQGQRRDPRSGVPIRYHERGPVRLLTAAPPPSRWAREHVAPGPFALPGGDMQRIGFVMGLLPGAEAEYRRRHAAVWPEMLAELKAAGASNYSIFLDGDRLFGYLEVEDLGRFQRHMAASTVNARWQADMGVLIDPLTDPETGFHRQLDEVF